MTIGELQELTNDKGRQLIERWLMNKNIEYVYFPVKKSNWFYVLFDNNVAVSMPFIDSGANGSFFGDKKYLEEYLKKEYGIYHPKLIFELMELKL